MKFKSFSRTASIVGLTLVTGLLTGCTDAIREGNFGIEKYAWSQTYNPEIIEGRVFNAFDTIYQIYGRERIYNLIDQKPKDRDGILVSDLDISIMVKIQKKGALAFLQNKGGLSLEQDAEGEVYLIGKEYIIKDANSVLAKTFAKIQAESLLNDRGVFEKLFQQDLQAEFDELYGKETFLVTEIKIASYSAGPITESKIQSIQAIKAEDAKNTALLNALAKKEEFIQQEAQMYKKIATNSGLTVDQVLYNEMIKTIGASDSKTVVTVEAKPK